jgi:hypothetical protein
VLCIGRVGKGTGFGLVCGVDSALCEVVETEDVQRLV